MSTYLVIRYSSRIRQRSRLLDHPCHPTSMATPVHGSRHCGSGVRAMMVTAIRSPSSPAIRGTAGLYRRLDRHAHRRRSARSRPDRQPWRAVADGGTGSLRWTFLTGIISPCSCRHRLTVATAAGASGTAALSATPGCRAPGDGRILPDVGCHAVEVCDENGEE